MAVHRLSYGQTTKLDCYYGELCKWTPNSQQVLRFRLKSLPSEVAPAAYKTVSNQEKYMKSGNFAYLRSCPIISF